MRVERLHSPILALRIVTVWRRAHLDPFRQQILPDPGIRAARINADGQVVTKAVYDGYKDFGGTQFPTVIDISRPLEELSLKVQITKLTLNETLEDDQFDLKVPDGVTVKKM